MRCSEIVKLIEKTYPPAYACSWDNSGLQAGRLEKEVTRIYVALDVTKEVIHEAIQKDADMIITHHPMLFKPLSRVTNEDFTGTCVVSLLQHDICCYAMHTNYDVLGMADLAADLIGLNDRKVLDPADTGSIPEAMRISDKAEGIGRIGLLSVPLSLESCCALVKEKFGLEHVTFFGDPEKSVKTAAICPGSGRSEIMNAAAGGADVLITGDIGHHEGLDALANGLAVIDAGHYGLEHIFVKNIMQYFTENIAETVVFGEEIHFPSAIV